MNSRFGAFTKGIATGLAVGATVTMVTRPMDMRKKRRMKRTAAKALHTFGDIIESAQNIIK